MTSDRPDERRNFLFIFIFSLLLYQNGLKFLLDLFIRFNNQRLP